MSDDDVAQIIRQLHVITEKNPTQAQLLLQQNPNLLYALLEAEYQQGMITEAVPGVDLLIPTNKS